ncbi:MAG: hypothetical protein ACF787_02565 [Rhodopirellula sp. JB053]
MLPGSRYHPYHLPENRRDLATATDAEVHRAIKIRDCLDSDIAGPATSAGQC